MHSIAYQLHSFHPNEFITLLSTFFADEYVTNYVVKTSPLQTNYFFTLINILFI